MSFYSDCYRIAELVHQGVDDDYIRDECEEVALRTVDRNLTAGEVYRASERIYAQEFESR